MAISSFVLLVRQWSKGSLALNCPTHAKLVKHSVTLLPSVLLTVPMLLPFAVTGVGGRTLEEAKKGNNILNFSRKS